MKARTTKPKKAPKETEGRKKSKLTIASEDAARGLLLKTLKENDWRVNDTARSLDMAPPTVLRSIKALGLSEEYEAARVRGNVKPGPKKQKRAS